MVNLEMRVGKTRIEALRELARRTGLDDIKALVAMLVQTERFGTSIAQSLRIHSDDLRIKRRQRAEEMSAKTTVKMVPALVFFIFPALMVVILGPAVYHSVRQLQPRRSLAEPACTLRRCCIGLNAIGGSEDRLHDSSWYSSSRGRHSVRQIWRSPVRQPQTNSWFSH